MRRQHYRRESYLRAFISCGPGLYYHSRAAPAEGENDEKRREMQACFATSHSMFRGFLMRPEFCGGQEARFQDFSSCKSWTPCEVKASKGLRFNKTLTRTGRSLSISASILGQEACVQEFASRPRCSESRTLS